MRRITRAALLAAATVPLALGLAVPSAQATPTGEGASFGTLYHDGDVVRTVVTPTSMPGEGVDAIYAFPVGTTDQLNVTSVAPGDPGYHGGRWAVHVVTWNVAPYLLTSDEDVLQAESSGDVTITRMPAADFVCPVAGR